MMTRLGTALCSALVLLLLPSAGDAQPELRRMLRNHGLPVVPRVPRMPFAPRGVVDAPFPVPVPPRGAFLAPQEVLTMLSARNLALVGELRRRGDYYILDAQGPSGEVVRLVVNGFSGTVEGVRVRGRR